MSHAKTHFKVWGGGLALALVVASALAVASLASVAVSAQKKPKPALKDSDARRAIAATPLFALNTGAVKVRSVSAAGVTPVVVTAEVELAVLLRQVGGETEAGEGGGWRAEEFRTGDRSWERFEWLAEALDYRQLEGARVALQSAALEFEARQRARKSDADDARVASDKNGAGGEGDAGDKSGATEDSNSPIEVKRGPLRMTELSPISSSARAVVFVEASFELERGADKKWRVVAVRLGDEEVRELEGVVASVNRSKRARALADLETMRGALEEFRRERGFYVVSEDHVVLIDHLSPRYLAHVIRVDPWHRPYRYAGTRERFTLRSDGPDGVEGTADDVTLTG
ncbi:MAG TPA: type II secretion system protein GspG [Pyrinomonadaceae bacterium]|nr:type II secretion system protein GspG [Pyrinomonadaceae bacterium]